MSCSMDEVAIAFAQSYDNYRDHAQLLSNYIMSDIPGYHVYIVEKDIDILNVIFMSYKDESLNMIFRIRKNDFCNISKIMRRFVDEINKRDCKCT